MYLAYVDESGDKGKDGSNTYVLACVFVSSSQWASAFDGVLAFRRYLKGRFGVPIRAEIKANVLIKNGGDLRVLGLSEKVRRFIYRGLIQLQPKLKLQTFAIVIDKPKIYGGGDPFEFAWTYLLQRLERLSTIDKTEVLILHDQGDDLGIRKMARKSRRFGMAGSMFGSGSLKVPFTGLLDDPVSRDSRHSFFIQVADLNAYAAFRRVYPPPAKTVQIVPSTTWDSLGPARFAPANQRGGGPSDGIVLWPK